MMNKFVYLFNEGNSEMKEILGGKGANLAEMTSIGLPVPFGFTISTQACNNYYEAGKQISEEVERTNPCCTYYIRRKIRVKN